MSGRSKINPNHYKPHGIITHEPIEIMKGMLTPDAYRGFLVGNVIKYVCRYDSKNGAEDLEKAKKYIDFLEADLNGYSPMYAQNNDDEEANI